MASHIFRSRQTDFGNMERMDNKIQKTFWGCKVNEKIAPIIEVNKSLHICKASLDIVSDNLPECQMRVHLYMHLNGAKHLICLLDMDGSWQVPLDINIEKGTLASFTIGCSKPFECKATYKWSCSIHRNDYTVYLTGYQHSEEELPEKIAEIMTAVSMSFIQETLERTSKARESMDIKTSDRSIEDKPDENSTHGSKDMTALGSKGNTDEQEKKGKSEAANRQNIPEENEEQEERFKKDEKLATGENVTEIETEERQQNISGSEQQHQVHDSSLHVEILNLGEGLFATIGNSVSVNYVGHLVNKKHSYTVFENGFEFCLGKGEVIRGLDEGITGMKLGEKRRITCPPSMAYGMEGAPPIIPRNSIFVFEIELVGICC